MYNILLLAKAKPNANASANASAKALAKDSFPNLEIKNGYTS
jgi:hypothetical protein